MAKSIKIGFQVVFRVVLTRFSLSCSHSVHTLWRCCKKTWCGRFRWKWKAWNHPILLWRLNNGLYCFSVENLMWTKKKQQRRNMLWIGCNNLILKILTRLCIKLISPPLNLWTKQTITNLSYIYRESCSMNQIEEALSDYMNVCARVCALWNWENYTVNQVKWLCVCVEFIYFLLLKPIHQTHD